MPKEFYTERDIEDMFKRGIQSLQLNDDVVLTDLAYEKANRLGMRLLRDRPENPPAAPVRPYLSQGQPAGGAALRVATAASSSASAARASASSAGAPGAGGMVPPPHMDGGELRERIRGAVIARLGNQVDAKLLDVIISRVLQSTGIK